MKFEVKNRWSGSVQFTADIECDESASYRFKLGLAVRWAFKGDADLSDADLSGAYLRDADLRGAYLRDADLRDADLSGAYLRGAYLRDADLSDADLSGAYLRDADLRGAYLRDADLRDADLSGAYLRGAYLRDADLRDADLSGAYLRGAYLRDADLSDADLSGADLSGAIGASPELTTPLLMLLDQPGPIRAYKLVNENSEGHYRGGIKYKVGKPVSVENADTDARRECAAGINVATLDWCLKEWRPGYRILIVEFTAEDIAAIPTATDGKFRLHRCNVVAEKQFDPVSLGLVKAEEPVAAA